MHSWKYENYLVSKDWKDKRALVLERDKNTCKMCKFSFNRSSLEVHHITYKNLFHEPLADLVTLCKKCHKQIHKIKPDGSLKREKSRNPVEKNGITDGQLDFIRRQLTTIGATKNGKKPFDLKKHEVIKLFKTVFLKSPDTESLDKSDFDRGVKRFLLLKEKLNPKEKEVVPKHELINVFLKKMNWK